MGDKTYTTILDCGCMIADDTGTTEEPNGDAGCIPCFSEYGNMNDPKDKARWELCKKSWKEYNESRRKIEAPLSDLNNQRCRCLNNGIRCGYNSAVSEIQQYLHRLLKDKSNDYPTIFFKLQQKLPKMIFTYGTEKPE